MKFFVYSLLFSLLFSLGAKLKVFVNYFANQKYYAEVLCKNKNKKRSCCKGKCALEKELLDISSKEEDQPAGAQDSVLKLGKAEEAVCSSLKLDFISDIISTIKTTCLLHVSDGSSADLLKPPLI